MKSVCMILAGVLVVLAACAKKEEPAQKVMTAGEEWAAQAATITVGARRAEVEEKLPIYHKGPTKRTVKEKSQEVIYWVDAQWRVTIEYDFTGVDRSQGGKNSFDSPENRVVTPPRVERHYL